MKIEQMLDVTRVNEPEYLYTWLKFYSEMIKPNTWEPEHSMETIVRNLEENEIVKTGDVGSWRPYVCSYFLGEEGGGAYIWAVFAIAKEDAKIEKHVDTYHIPDALVYFKFTGHYDSYDDNSWYTCPSIVTPKIKTNVYFD